MSAAPVVQIPSARAAIGSEIEQTLRMLAEPGSMVEVRAPKTPDRGTVSGYYEYDQLAKCAQHVITQLDGRVPGVYITLNPVKRDVAARAYNRLQARAQVTTNDAEIVRRRWLPLDFDPERPAGISSSGEEHANALERAEIVAEFLSEVMGWPDPLRADSGNGAHLLYRIDLPNDEDSRKLVEHVLKALASAYDGRGVKLDTSVGNAARIWKLYPTLAMKGDSLPERPHRRSHLLCVPEPVEVVTAEHLAQVCDELLDATTSDGPYKGTSSSTPTAERALHIADAGDYLREHGVEVAFERSGGGRSGVTYVLAQCVWDPAHTDKSAWVTQFPSGSIAAGCKHNSCSGKRLADFRDAVEPGWRDRPATTSAPIGNGTSSSIAESDIEGGRDRSFPLLSTDGQNRAEADRDDRDGSDNASSRLRRDNHGHFPLLSPADLAAVGFARPEMLVAGKILKRSFTITYGHGKTGKSYYVQSACFDLAAAGVPVWYIAGEGFDGIYLRMLAWQATHPGKTLDALRVIPMPVQLFQHAGAEAKILAAQARDMPDEYRPTVIVVDTIHRCVVSARESDNGDMGCVALAAAHWRIEAGATTWGIHHEGKSAGQGMRGASCLFDDPDSVQYIFRGGDISVVECEAQRDGVEPFEPEAFTLDSQELDKWGFPRLSAKVLKPLASDQIILARRMWAADQQRKMTGAKNAPGGDDTGITPTLQKALDAFKTALAEHPAGVYRSVWRSAYDAAGLAPGSFDWCQKQLQRAGKVRFDDQAGYFQLGADEAP